MFDTRKIDSFFSGEKNLFDEEEKSFISRRTKVVRFLELFLPCLTAMLFAIGVALFDFDNSTNSNFSIDKEKKVYFEKFRMKNIVFEVTEKDNQISTIKADTVEETIAGSKIYNLTNPDAQSTNNKTNITIVSKVGIYNQNTHVLNLSDDIVANYNNEMTIKTDNISYNFKSMEGFGNSKISGIGTKGSFSANRFSFNKNHNTITLINNVFLSSNDIEVSTPKDATLYANDNKFIAEDAIVKKGNETLKGNVLTVFFKNAKSFDIDSAYCKGNAEIYSGGEKAYADNIEYLPNSSIIKLNGNVRIVKGTNIATSDRAIYFQNKEEFHLYNNVKIQQSGATAIADKGVYFIKKNVAELEKNVVISKDGNMVKGDKAISDFNTSKSRLIAINGGRISGKLTQSKPDKKED